MRLSRTGIFLLLLSLLFGQNGHAQKKLLLKDKQTGRLLAVKRGKLVGLVTLGDTIKFADRDSYPYKSYWCLKDFTDSTLTVEFKKTLETRTVNFRQLLSISLKRNESTGSPVALAMGGLICVMVSPFVGIHKDGYNLENVGLTFGVGAGLLATTYLTNIHKDLREYTLLGVKQ